MIEVVLSIAAITGGPLLLPSLWALFSKKITGKAAFIISGVCLLINCIFKFITPWLFNIKLVRAEEMLLGAGLPLLFLIVYQFVLGGNRESADYRKYMIANQQRKDEMPEETKEEKQAIQKQNLFGLRVIAFALAFTSLLLIGISFVAVSGKYLVLGIAAVIMLSALIPFNATRKIKMRLLAAAT
jgi:hypothetical protein